MDAARPCLICGVIPAQRCHGCQDATYCSVECQHADWRTHKLLCRPFAKRLPRPSSSHVLIILFPLNHTRPRLLWVDSEEDSSTPGYFHPCLDHLLNIPGATGYIGRGLFPVRGNHLRGRSANADTLNIWYLDDARFPDLPTNMCIHGTVPTLIGDTWGEMIWKGPIVAVLKQGREADPHRLQDITLAAYRDAIDYLGYYRDTYGSMIDGPGSRTHLALRVIEERAGKVKGVRINCLGDQAARHEDPLVLVDVPKTHPLFNLEGDDPFSIPDQLEFPWVAKRYTPATSLSSSHESENPLARLLLLQADVHSNVWGGVRAWWEGPIGSVLVVDRRGRDLSVPLVHAMCSFIDQLISPMMKDERKDTQEGRCEVWAAITVENFNSFYQSLKSDPVEQELNKEPK